MQRVKPGIDNVNFVTMNMKADSERLSKILRRLTPRQEKVVRLHFGLGCKRSHSVAEIAAEFGVTTALITGILEAATRRLAKAAVMIRELREAAHGVTFPRRTHASHRPRRP